MIDILPSDEAKITAIIETSTDHVAQFFAYGHLPEHLRAVSRPFAMLATHIISLPRNPERTVALRKLLESKDAAVRAMLSKPPAITPE